MDIYTVSLFGHRIVNDPTRAVEKIEKLAAELICNKEYVEFLVGREGDFDIIAASAIKTAKKKLDYGNCSLTLVLPYMKAEYRKNTKEYHEYYDDVEICAEASETHFKNAITVRNRAMADRSDLVICCIDRESGGAYKAVRYAENKKIKIINVSDSGYFQNSDIS